MPHTRLQILAFMGLTVLLSVVCFTTYNVALAHGGLSNRTFALALREVPAEFALAFLLEALVVYRLAQRMAFRYVNPSTDRPIVIVLALTGCTITLMCPSMSLASVLLHQGPGPDLIARWLRAVVWNFPFAFFTQVFFIGPTVRTLCRGLFPVRAGQPLSS
nr:DUF2798 domain-containing protein [uncultured Holophaga sp.]